MRKPQHPFAAGFFADRGFTRAQRDQPGAEPQIVDFAKAQNALFRGAGAIRLRVPVVSSMRMQ